MKSRFAKIALALILLLTLVVPASANRSVSQDTVWNLNGGASDNNNNAGLYAEGAGGSCTVNVVTYLQWDLSTIAFNTVINYVAVSLQATGSGSTDGATLGLYAVSSNAWTEDTQNGSLPARPVPGTDTPLATTTVANGIATPTEIKFSGTGAANALVQHVQARLATGQDRIVSFAVAWTSGCDLNFTSTVTFEDAEGSLASGAAGPDLLVTASDANAVRLSTFRPADSATNWPLFLAVGVLGLVAAGIVFRKVTR